MTFQPSVQQQTIFDQLKLGLDGGGNIIVDAKAGSGKTTTIVEGIKYIPKIDGFIMPRVVFLAFNKNIATELGRRCPTGTVCSTFHSLGFRALKNSGIVPRNVKVETNKARKLVWNATDRDDPDVRNIIRLVSIAKTVAVDVSEVNFEEVSYHFDIVLDRPEWAYNVARSVVSATLEDTTQVDFDDMLYMPVMFDVAFDKYNYVFVDEAQDTNDIQLDILERLRAPKSRFIAVGDPHQAIYGFRGANADSMSRISARFRCATYPLSVSYRCPKAVVKEAQKWLSHES